MAPTIPYFRSPRGQCAAAITISSSGSDQSIANTLVILSSATSSTSSDQSTANTLVILSSATSSTSSVVIVPDSSASRGGDEARGGQRSAPRRRRPLSVSAVPVRSPTVVTAASFATTTSGRTTAAPHQCPSPRSVLSVRAPGAVVPDPPSSGGGGGGAASDGDDDEATSRPKKKYRKWATEDELKVLSTFAELRRDNLGVPPQASVLLKKICDDGGLLRRGVDATELSDKVSKLKKKFIKAAAKVAASARGRRRRRKSRDKVLYEISMKAWPDLLPSGSGGQSRQTPRKRRQGLPLVFV